ncbi:hypothetical protein ACFQH9_07980, partial [Pseudonocardia lutea]
AARHATGEAAPGEVAGVADLEDTDTPAGLAGTAAVVEGTGSTPVAGTSEAPVGMDEPDTG